MLQGYKVTRLQVEHERIHFFSERNESEISKWISVSVSFLTNYENQNPGFYETKFWKKRNFAEISFLKIWVFPKFDGKFCPNNKFSPASSV